MAVGAVSWVCERVLERLLLVSGPVAWRAAVRAHGHGLRGRAGAASDGAAAELALAVGDRAPWAPALDGLVLQPNVSCISREGRNRHTEPDYFHHRHGKRHPVFLGTAGYSKCLWALYPATLCKLHTIYYQSIQSPSLIINPLNHSKGHASSAIVRNFQSSTQ